MKKEIQIIQSDSDQFGLGRFDFSIRTPEKSEMFDKNDAQTYIDGCDYPESADDLLLALEMQRLFGAENIRRMKILDAMCGPGRLGREFLNLGAHHVVFQDGDETMISHARNKAFEIMRSGQNMGFVTSNVDNILLPDNMFDLIIVHNATHQLSSLSRLSIVMEEFLRITTARGHIVIADYQRATTPEFFQALKDRLKFTKPEIVPLLIPSFTASFSKDEFTRVIKKMSGVMNWSVTNAQTPTLTADMQKRVNSDPVKGHLMDFSPISLLAIVQKDNI